MSTLPSWFAGITDDEIMSVAAIEQIGPINWNRLYEHFSSFQELLVANEEALRRILPPGQVAALQSRSRSNAVVERLLKSKSIMIIRLGDPEYPPLLAEIPDPPLWLFVRGALEAFQRPLLAVIGSRDATGYAKASLEVLLPEELAEKITIVSGLAFGVDKIAHQRSLTVSASTIAVLAGGLDTVYPIEHSAMAEKIIDCGGALVSEYPPLSRPRPYRFPVRNRIIAGLCPATVVVEAAIKSGSLTTAKSALEYNRDIFAVPGDITRAQSSGTNFLLQHGAIPLLGAAQLFEYFSLSQSTRRSPVIDKSLQKILDLLTPAPLTIDQLVIVTKQPIEVVLGGVTQLELLGLVYQQKPGLYHRK